MSGKRLALILALALAVGLMGETKPRYGAYQVVGGGDFGAGVQKAVTKTYLFKLAPQGTNRSCRATGNTNWEADLAAADQVVNLPVDSLALDFVMSRNKSTNASPGDRRPAAETDSSAGYNGLGGYLVTQSHTDGSFPNRSASVTSCVQTFGLLWIPFDQYIPDGWTITDAQIRLMSDAASTSMATASDTLCVVAMAEGDSAWYKGKKTEPTVKYVARAASWRNQVQPAYQAADSGTTRHDRTANGYPRLAAFVAGTYDSLPWNPSLDSRIRTLDFGPRSLGVTPAANYGDAAPISIDAKRVLQKMISGEVPNNGMLIAEVTNYTYNGSGTVAFVNFEGSGADSVNYPYVIVTATSREYEGGPWAGKEVGFAFVADGGHKTATDLWTDAFAARGLQMTVAPILEYVGDSGYVTGDDLVGYLDAGHEVGSQTRNWTARGLAEYLWNTSTGYDSTVTKLDPAVIDSILAANDNAARGEAYFAAHPRVGKSIACPNNIIGHAMAINVADSLGYLALRTYAGSAGIGLQPTPGDTAGANVGSSTIGRRVYGLTSARKFNTLIVPSRWYDYNIFGTASAPVAEAAAKRRLRLAIEDCAVRGNQLMVIYSHYSVLSDANPGGGMTSDNTTWLLDTVTDEGNVLVAPLCELVRFTRRNMDGPYDHPAWGGTMWQDQVDGLHYKGR